MHRIRIVHVTQSLSRLAGGLFESVRHLSQAVDAVSDVHITVLGLRDPMTTADAGHWAPLPIETYPVWGGLRFGFAPGLYAALTKAQPHVIHLHGLWKYTSLVAWWWAKAHGCPYIVSPHGMLEPWSLTQSRIKKWMANQLYQGACLRQAMCIRATSKMEVESIRLAGYRTPIALVPNGVEIPAKPLPRFPRESGRPRRVLFLSRIHRKKGLINLVKAWEALHPVGWELLIVGPDEEGHLAEVKAAVAECRLQEQILFPGEVWGEEKNRLYCSSDLFVLPTFSENFGLVVAEALSCEVPVITTRAAPWHELEEERCGWWIDTGVAPLVAALREALAMAPDELHEMGVRGRQLIEDRYTWEPIGHAIVEVYDWMLGKQPKPGCIID